MIDIEKLRSFYYVIKEGSLMKAARVLDKNHTTLSKHLTDLEDTYNVKLFIRKRKRLELTEKGNELFKLAQSTIPNLENGANEILTPKKPQTKLRILTTTGIIGIWIIQKLKILIEQYPELKIDIVTTNADIDFDAAKADIGILPKQGSPDLSQRKLTTLHSYMFASPEYVKKYGIPKTLDDLNNHRLIGFYSDFEGNVGNVDWHLKRGMPEFSVRENYLNINSAFLVYEAALQGLGILAVGEEFEYLKTAGFVKILPNEIGPIFDIYYVTRKDAVLTKLQRDFLEILKG